MMIDKAIAHCLEVAEQNDFETRIYDDFNKSGNEEYRNNHSQCAAEHRQLAEWLTELKKLREENKVLMQECDRLIKEKGELLKQHEQIGKYKRVLKSATNVLNMFIPCDEDYCSECIKQSQNCDYDDNFKWLYADEALKLI